MARKARELREGDTLLIEVRVTRVSDDEQLITIAVGDYLTSFHPAAIESLIVKHEKGNNWPE